jgi:acyl-homoserine-lactone acylase
MAAALGALATSATAGATGPVSAPAPATAAPAAASRYAAEIRRTDFGIPHITARNFVGLGYGQGYAFAQDNLCMAADHFVTLRGERSKAFGAGGVAQVAMSHIPNAESDAFFRAEMDMEGLRAGARKFSPEYAALVQGFIAGYNRYLRDSPAERRPAACRNAAWVQPVTLDDFLRLNEEKMIQGGSGRWLRQAVAAHPPAEVPARTASRGAVPQVDLGDHFELGSNAWAFGRDVTVNHTGLLLGNPHFPWDNTNRFYESHLTVPGKLDVMGVSLYGVPGVAIGFNHDIAWSHTVSTDRHFTVFELTLDPTDPTVYLVDGKPVPMERRTVQFDVAGEGSRTATLYWTVYGPVVVEPSARLAWTTAHAYAVQDANHLNTRSGDAWLSIARAHSVSEVREAIDREAAIPWVNTIAADRSGQVMYADVTSTPNVSLEQLKACAPKSGLGILGAIARLYVLDGSRSDCRWAEDARAAAPGHMPASSMPHLLRTDFVANSNDSFWLANPAAPLTGFSPVVGAVDTAQNLRTRAGLIEIAARLAGKDGRPGNRVGPDDVAAMLYANRNLAAELYLDDLLAICAARPQATLEGGRTVDLRPACAVLAQWNRRMDRDSRGAQLFHEFWKKAATLKDINATPFDRNDPVHTPRGLKREGPAADGLLRALGDAVALLEARGVSLSATWGSLAVQPASGGAIALHGGDGEEGVLNAHRSRWVDGTGYVTESGSSYIQIVTFGADGPVARAVLTYSQSTDPASPHAADQTRLYSEKRWVNLPFLATDVARRTRGAVLQIRE